MEYVIVPGRKDTVMKRIITFDKKVRLIIFNLPDFLLILRKNKSDQIKIISITMHSEGTTGSKFRRYAKVCKRDCYKGIFKKFMARKPGIHGHYQPNEEKACYNKPRN